MKYITKDEAIAFSTYMAKKYSIGIKNINVDEFGNIVITYSDDTTSTISGELLMAKSVYDTANRGKVDLSQDSEKLGGQLPAYYTTSDNIEYDNDISGLTAEDIKTAIDEIVYMLNNIPNVPISAGAVAKPTYTDNGNGTITIGDVTVNLFVSDTFIGDVNQYTVTGGNFTPTNNANSYLVVDYNDNDPMYKLITDVSLINESTVVPIYSFYREDNYILRLNWDSLGVGLSNKIHQRLVYTRRFERESGLALSESATRVINVGGGIVWYGAIRNSLEAVISNVDTCRFYRHVAGVYVNSSVTQYNNSQYDDGTNLQPLSNNYYTVNWVYRNIEDGKHIELVLGNAQYNQLSLAIESQPRTDLPNVIKTNSVLVGRIIVQSGASTASKIEGAFDTTFIALPVNTHNDLAGIQGGATGEYYHLTSADALSIPNKLDKATFEKLNRFGFTSLAETTIAFDGVNTFTLTRTGASFSYFRSGVLNTITTNKTATLATTPPATAGLYYIYIDDNIGTLTVTTSPWDLSDTKVPVATIYWNNALTPKYQLSEERHTCLIDRQTHRYEHLTRGTQLVSGSTLSGYTLNSSVDANKTFAISQAVIADEDLFETLTALVDTNGASASYVNAYRTSPTAWVWNESIMPFKYTTTGFIEYDNNGVMTPIANNRYANTYLLLSNIKGSARFVFVSGRGNFANATSAYAESFGTFDMTGFITTESIALYQLTWEGDTNGGTGQCQLNRVQKITSNLVTTTTNVSVDHNGLANLQGGAVGEYYHLTSAKYTELLTNRADSEANWSLIGIPANLSLTTDYQKITNTDTVKIPTALTSYFTIDANKQDITCLKTGVVKITRSVTVADIGADSTLSFIPTVGGTQNAECLAQETQRFIKDNETKNFEVSFYLNVTATNIVSLLIKANTPTTLTYGNSRTTIEYISITI